MHPMLIDAPGAKRLLLGNEAIVRGALEAGVGFVSTYPGTPASEIGDGFYQMAGQSEVQFEYSVNEKVALEVAAGAAISGAYALCAMKHVGLNVAADPLMTLAYTGIRGALVIVTADDPSCHSSQNEQDNRYYSFLSQLPMLDPASPVECFQMIKAAFDLSHRHQLPVLFRTTTRVAHARGVVEIGELAKPIAKGEWISEPRRFMPVPAIARLRHPILRQQTAAIAHELAGSDFDYEFGAGTFGIITSGAGSTYAEDIVRAGNLTKRVRVLKVGVAHPLDKKKVAAFLGKVKRVLIVEELEPFLEEQIKVVAYECGAQVKIFGKGTGHLSPMGELNPDLVARALFDLVKVNGKKPKPANQPMVLPPRPPNICAGCPHRATFYLAKMAVKENDIFVSDIGCYTLAFIPPLSVGDLFICMGSSASSSGGITSVTGKRVIAFIGDSTFFHSGMTGLVNSVKQKRNVKLVIMDNRTTGMTGHQPHPGSRVPGKDDVSVSIEKIVEGIGVKHMAVIDPLNLGDSIEQINKVLDAKGPGVIISRSPCPLYDRKVLKKIRPAKQFKINHDLCKRCGRETDCLYCDQPPHAPTTLIRSRKGIETSIGKALDYNRNITLKMTNSPCEAACPARICVQGYIGRIAGNDIPGAIEIIRQRTALPNVLCRICDRPCEKVCIRNDYDEPVAINQLKRFAMDQETGKDRVRFAGKLVSKIKENGKNVAVVGAGPAGLQCAYDLRLRGYQVTVFEKEDKGGGIARWAIPRYRLPKSHIKKDVDLIKAIGVKFEFGIKFGENFDEPWLRQKDFLAGFLAIGQQRGAALKIPGEQLAGVIDSISFLEKVGRGKEKLQGTAIVIGGGNAAIDSARAALRIGAEKVLILYRRSKNEIPADPKELDAAIKEGVKLEYLSTVASVESKGSRLRLFCKKMSLGKADRSGRAKPVSVKGKGFFRLCNHLVIAVGQVADKSSIKTAGVKSDRRSQVKIDENTGACSDSFWFAGGDVVTGASTFVKALEAGKRAAYGIDLKLSDSKKDVLIEVPANSEALLNEKRYAPEKVQKTSREISKSAPMLKRVNSFFEVEQTFTKDQAQKEADRCLACGICRSCNNCIDNFGCPAIFKEGGKIYIDPVICDGCGTCMQICPNGAIELVEN